MSNEPHNSEETQSTPPEGQILLEGARQVLGRVDEIEAVGASTDVLRVRADDEWYVVRVWPDDVSAQQVELTGAALNAAADASALFPRPRAVGDAWSLTVDGRLVSAMHWLPGRPLARYGDFRTPDGDAIDVPLPASAPAMDVVLEAVEAMGRFHTATASLARRSDSGATSLTSLMKRTERTWEEQRRVVGDKAGNAPEIRRWLRCGNRVLPVANEHLSQVSTMARTTSLIHGDLWPVNLLVEGTGSEQRLVGITGWSTVREGSR